MVVLTSLDDDGCTAYTDFMASHWIHGIVFAYNKVAISQKEFVKL